MSLTSSTGKGTTAPDIAMCGVWIKTPKISEEGHQKTNQFKEGGSDPLFFINNLEFILKLETMTRNQESKFNQEAIIILKKFISSALREIDKFEKGLQSREDTAWKIVDLGINLKIFDLIENNQAPQNIKEILDLAADLEVPDNVYKGDVHKDMNRLIYLIKNAADN